MNKAYLVIDMSNDFVDDNGSLSVGKKAQAIVPAVLRRINKFYNDNDYIIFCMDNHTKGDKHFELWPEHCIKDTWGAQLYGDIGKWLSLIHILRSGSFVFAISSTCAFVSVATLTLLGVPEAVSMPSVFFIRTAAGGVFVMNENVLS